MSIPEEIRTARYVSVTTFRRDGRPVPTPVGHAVDGDELLVLTQRDSGKVKRIRNNAAVRVAPCDMSGRVAEGAPTATGRARVLDQLETARVRRVLSRRYAIARFAFLAEWFLGRRDRRVGIAITL
ncbi:PPOX class F420-dependent oxidoreductase [Plantactinospora endophytica]|uniref:PPOX class F420-dependent oxidoreductase n=1 Tax=Plantactinospora endophytica TaxID=673535 RepID=A0ABQ4DXQ1_9ACTN|nr:PPOX class F420-dependent oxidoreductase [Plantactinospora endophytica]GIG87235.1 PPOX class F420-dependent oxidoreductase [Plantactinospora endophytica]